MNDIEVDGIRSTRIGRTGLTVHYQEMFQFKSNHGEDCSCLEKASDDLHFSPTQFFSENPDPMHMDEDTIRFFGVTIENWEVL